MVTAFEIILPQHLESQRLVIKPRRPAINSEPTWCDCEQHATESLRHTLSKFVEKDDGMACFVEGGSAKALMIIRGSP
jgi:hypothetical protein